MNCCNCAYWDFLCCTKQTSIIVLAQTLRIVINILKKLAGMDSCKYVICSNEVKYQKEVRNGRYFAEA